MYRREVYVHPRHKHCRDSVTPMRGHRELAHGLKQGWLLGGENYEWAKLDSQGAETRKDSWDSKPHGHKGPGLLLGRTDGHGVDWRNTETQSFKGGWDGPKLEGRTRFWYQTCLGAPTTPSNTVCTRHRKCRLARKTIGRKSFYSAVWGTFWFLDPIWGKRKHQLWGLEKWFSC